VKGRRLPSPAPPADIIEQLEGARESAYIPALDTG